MKVYVELPGEDKPEGMCGRLNTSMYGTRDAAQNWEEYYAQAHKEMGFEQGMSSTGVFVHKERMITVVIHGDDFTALGNDKDLDWYRGMVQSKMETKVKCRLGPGKCDLKQI